MSDTAKSAAPPRAELFSVECTTCKARLKVRSSAAIGQILACPKCNSMVMIAPPADWQAGAPPVAAATAAPSPPIEQPTAAGSFAGKALVLACAATVVCGVAVFAASRFTSRQAEEIPVASTAPEAMPAEDPAPEPTVETPAAVDAEAPPVEDVPEAPPPDAQPLPTETSTALVESPAPADAAPQADPAPEVVVDEPSVEPVTPPAKPAPEAAPPIQDVSTRDDLLRRLQTSVAGIDEPSIRLDALAELLGGLAACPIELDDESLRAAGLDGETFTSLQVEGASVEAALTAALQPLGLEFEPRGKAIVIFARAK